MVVVGVAVVVVVLVVVLLLRLLCLQSTGVLLIVSPCFLVEGLCGVMLALICCCCFFCYNLCNYSKFGKGLFMRCDL